ncbi:hypothetical protein OIV83_003597 [Microbotryomycetes sp. JL201]|nr:hypothetical protein OIV83_003597 [Microbotryomycetes sp. JL201]
MNHKIQSRAVGRHTPTPPKAATRVADGESVIAEADEASTDEDIEAPDADEDPTDSHIVDTRARMTTQTSLEKAENPTAVLRLAASMTSSPPLHVWLELERQLMLSALPSIAALNRRLRTVLVDERRRTRSTRLRSPRPSNLSSGV